MSYRILYNSVFVKSELGITPVILSGDNNVYDTDGHGRSIRRSRDWGCFQNRLAESEEKLLAEAKRFYEDDEVWRKKGHTVTGAGLVRWMQNGVRTAMTLEDIFRINGISRVLCYIIRWEADESSRSKRVCQKYVLSTEDFDTWVKEAKQFAAEHKDGYNFFIVNFVRENIHKKEKRADADMVILKSANGYLSGRSENGYHWNQNIHSAMKLTSDEAKALLTTEPTWRDHVWVQTAGRRANPFDVIICVRRNDGRVSYVRKFANKVVHLTPNKTEAWRYSNSRTAEAGLKRMSNILSAHGCKGEVVKV